MTASPTSEQSAVLFDIQRLALDDGPGIRTNLFFKGCSLRCAWCHNPESYVIDTQLAYNASLCVACRLCAEVCKHDVHEFRANRGHLVHHVSHERCVGCGACLSVCCYDALDLVGTSFTVDGLLEVITVDLPYYAIGEGGGVTLTGGEPMLQWQSVDALLDKLENVHVVVETSGYAPAEAFQQILPKVDLFLFDIKATSPEKHLQLCGVDNEQILKNLDLLCSSQSSVILRLPLIPTVNDDDEHLRGIAGLLDRYQSIPYAQIMPYHNLGESKRERFGMPPQADGIPNPGVGQRAKWLDKLSLFGAENIRCT